MEFCTMLRSKNVSSSNEIEDKFKEKVSKNMNL